MNGSTRGWTHWHSLAGRCIGGSLRTGVLICREALVTEGDDVVECRIGRAEMSARSTTSEQIIGGEHRRLFRAESSCRQRVALSYANLDEQPRVRFEWRGRTNDTLVRLIRAGMQKFPVMAIAVGRHIVGDVKPNLVGKITNRCAVEDRDGYTACLG